MIACVVDPGRNTSATPRSFRRGTSSCGMMPPPKTATSLAPFWRSRSTTAGKSVMWAPDMMDMPTASTSSWMAAATIISGVW